MADSFSLEEVRVALSPLERFEEYLQSRGKRITQQRRIIVEEVFRAHDHFDADDLLALVQKLGDRQRVSRPTVYRTLGELVDAGLLRKMTIDSRAVYEHDYGYPRHDHLHCQRCGRLIEFHSEQLEGIREAVSREHGFRATGHRFTITGVCGDCSRSPRRPRPLDLV